MNKQINWMVIIAIIGIFILIGFSDVGSVVPDDYMKVNLADSETRKWTFEFWSGKYNSTMYNTRWGDENVTIYLNTILVAQVITQTQYNDGISQFNAIISAETAVVQLPATNETVETPIDSGLPESGSGYVGTTPGDEIIIEATPETDPWYNQLGWLFWIGGIMIVLGLSKYPIPYTRPLWMTIGGAFLIVLNFIL